ncbi:uncharacterized protein LOC113862472 [Abrus precatorius]|uniref:Uncharacterized protein LOC113862472 n=1 Tax=Abrus precatorius TaxID=3816 RepID=A0A8B8L577_ABRPR|nr:uncharacterized protein LOC113862472 [Abrus precatorius]
MDPNTIVSTATESALQFGGSLVKRHLGYFFNYNEKFEEIKHHVEMLDDARNRVRNEVNVAEMNAEEIENDVQHWLKQVDEKIKEYESFLRDECHAKTSCSIGFFPNNLPLRYQLGKKATKMVEEMKADGLWNRKFHKVSYREGPSMDAALSNTGYESFGSRNKTTEMIMQALEDSTINMIGVYGVGGVGKTTLVKEVAKKAQEKKLFNVVVMANITRNLDIKKVQGQIAEILGMRLEEESEIVRADRIRRRLKKEKENTLIILDDLWDGLDLNRLGIPLSENDDGSQREVKDITDFGYTKMDEEKLFSDYNKKKKEKLSADYNKMKKEKLSGDHKGCKILLTSRSKDVLCNQMDVQERSIFPVGVLDEKEAETLLKKMAGIHVKNSEFDAKAIDIAKMCAGLPIALVSIGRALKNKSSFVWEDVCQQIKRQSLTGGQESIEFSAKLSYDHLKNEQLKHIFLHCARMGNDPLIMDLVKFCIGLGLLQGIYTIREARNRVNVLIEELKESSLLVESYSTDRFNMHDIMRDVALSILSKEKHAFFMKNAILDEWPHKDELERHTAIFLHYCDINDELPERIYCPRLEVFHIDNKDDFLKVPDNFFKDMTELRVLILSGVNLSSLPSSIKCLKKLRMLVLERCTLGKNLSIIGELKKLRILSLSGSNIESLPVELGQLDKLQHFDLSNCSKLRVIPSNIISRMNSLEEFHMRDNLILWETEHKIQSENASLSELRHLNQLRSLEIHIPSVVHFPQNLFFDKLDSYKIIIGEFNILTVGEFKMPDKYESVKFLALHLKEGIDIHSEKWVKMLFKGVENLLLGELDVHDVFYELNVEGFPNLKHLSIVNNFGIQYIIKSKEQSHPLEAFHKLESMSLYKLENLKKICHNELTEASFCRLKVIKIKSCGQLGNLFPFSMLRLLIMLETIEVCDCDSLKEIVSVERQTYTISNVKDDKIEFPQLRLLTLQSLPAFTCLYTGHKMPSITQLLELQVPNKDIEIMAEVEQGDTNACLSLFNEMVSIPKLEWLELSSINIQKIWSDQSLHCFQNLLTLNVTDCGNLKYLLSFSIAGSLVNLQSLFVSSCGMMEDIFRAEDARQNIDVFPKLKKMEIIRMAKLNTIWQENVGLHSFRSLDSLTITECHKLVTIFPSYMGQRILSLHSLVIIDCKLVENIFDFGNIPRPSNRNETNLHNVDLQLLPNLMHVWKEDSGDTLKYNNLQNISIYGSPNLKYLFPFSVANELEKLQSLEVIGCWGMKEIVAWDKGSNETAITFKFPHLNMVSLQQLFELGSFYRGNHTLEWPSLKKMLILNCYKLEILNTETIISQMKPIVLATEKVIYNLEYMAMSLNVAKLLQNYIISVHRMHKLQSLVLFGLKNTEILFWFLHRLPNLESLTLQSCLFKSVWDPASLISHEKIGVVMQLKELVLNNLLYLEEIGFEHDPLLQRVERLIILGCHKLTSIMPSSVSYNYLTHLEVTNCVGLSNLMTSSTAKSLVQLVTMKVSWCQMIEEIVTDTEKENVQEIEFRQLKALELVSLQSLKSFCSSMNCDLKLPLLENLVVSECPQMTKFAEVQSAPKLQKVHVVAGEKDKWYWKGDLNTTLEKIIKDQVSFESLKHMQLINYPELKEVRHGKPALPDNFFRNLKILEVNSLCENREIVIPSHILPYLKSLEELNVDGCDEVQVIFEIDDSETKKTKGTVFHLKKLILDDLRHLKCVWNKNPQGIVSFPNLQEVVVKDCKRLTKLFPLSIARNLAKLKTLEVIKCKRLEEIVGKEDQMELETTEMFEFPCLSSLVLRKLPRLTCFYLGRHHLECPMLECLDVSYCCMLKLFMSEFNSHQAVVEGPDRTLNRGLQQPLFLVEKVIHKLKELAINEKNIIFLSDRDLSLIRKLKLCFEDINEKATLPFDFLHKLPNLEYLKVKKCTGLMTLFPSKKFHVRDGTLVGLKKLALIQLHELNLIGLEHPWVKPFSEKLKKFKVIKCSRLEKLVHSAVSFNSLKELHVYKCQGMKYLFTISTAKSLEQLQILYILNCESIKEIVNKEDEDASHEIIFKQLSLLMLLSLPSLVTFYSGNATLQFSSLESATVIGCPNMQTFSRGVVDAPMFQKIQNSFSPLDLYFHNDLNTTMERLFHRKKIEVRNCQSVKAIFDVKDIGADMKTTFQLSLPLKKLILNQLPNLEYIWNMNPDEILSFQDLEEVYIDSCQSLKSLFPTSLSSHLVTLCVRHCGRLVEIFAEDEAAMKEEPKQFIFHCLTSLTLWELPELKYFYPGKHSLEWPMLKYIDIYCCDKLKLFTTQNHSGEDAHKEDQHGFSIDQQAIFLVEKVIPNLEHQVITKGETMTGQGQFGANVALSHLMQNLQILILQCYHEDDESNIFSTGLLEKIPNLEKLEVRCSSFNEMFPSQRPVGDCTKIISKLKGLCLNGVDKLSSTGLEHSWVEPLLKTLEILEVFSCPCLKIMVPSTVSFSNLTFLDVGVCHGLVYLLTSSTARSLGQLRHMYIRDCHAIQEIVSKEGDHESNEEITFGQLNTLYLESLPSILGFYSGTSKLKFPSLDQVTLIECPQMKYSYVPDLHQFILQEPISLEDLN